MRIGCLAVACVLAACGGKSKPVEPVANTAPPADVAPPPPPPDVEDVTVDTTGWPASCVAYLAANNEMLHCKGMPLEARQDMRKSFVQMTEAYKDITTFSAEALQQLGESCTVGTDSMKQALSSIDCTKAPAQ